VIPAIFQTIQNGLQSLFGSLALPALLIMLVIAVAFMIAGIDFRFALMMVSPLTLAFVSIGWFPAWVSVVFWIFVVAIAGFMLWSNLQQGNF